MPQAATGSVRQHKSPARDSPGSSGHRRTFGLLSDAWRFPGVGLTLGAANDHIGGFVHLGRGLSGLGVLGALSGYGDHYYGHWAYDYYPADHYYYHYRPIHYYAYPYYEPWYGYVYTSAYYPEPYAYRFYDEDVYYADQTPEAGSAHETAPESRAPPAEPQAEAARPYQPLPSEPGRETLAGKGADAFAAGDYGEARRLFAQAMLVDERDGYAKLLYALSNFALQDYDVAATALRRALLTTPELMNAPIDVRTLYAEASVWEGQLHKLDRYAAKHASNRAVQLLLAYLYFSSGDPQRSLALLAPIVEAAPGDDVAALLRDEVLRRIPSKPARP